MNERVGKAYLVEHVMNEQKLTTRDAEKVVNSVLDGIVTALRSGVSVTISNVGTLRPAMSAERVRRNPKTGENFLQPSQSTVRWTASPTLRDVLNGRSDRESLATKIPKAAKN